MIDSLNNSQMATTQAEDKEIKKEVNTQIHQHLSTIFVVVGIVSFTLGAIVNYYTIRRLNGYK
jgi:cytochrome c biogenesis protein ResB